MDVVELFGRKVGELAETNGLSARRLMLLGYGAQEFRLKHFPDKRLGKARRYLAWLVMDYMRHALSDPSRTAMTSLFVPCDPLVAIGWKAFSIEGFSAFMTGTRCEGPLLDADDTDQDLCSYHRIFLGASKLGLLPVSPFLISTNIACDANLVSFPEIKETYKRPSFFIDVPYEQGEDSVMYVARQLRDMVSFISDMTHRSITDGMLSEVQERIQRSNASLRKILSLSSNRYLPGDVTSCMYDVMMGKMMMGEKETERYWAMLADEYACAPLDPGKRLLWIHTVPFTQAPVRELLNFDPRIHVLGVDLALEGMMVDPDPTRPYESMARRLVDSPFNGPAEKRAELDLQLARVMQASGAVVFDHWGCKMTLGAGPIIKQTLEEAGIPVLLLDGDGADMRSQSDGQTKTRLEAFREMLG